MPWLVFQYRAVLVIEDSQLDTNGGSVNFQTLYTSVSAGTLTVSSPCTRVNMPLFREIAMLVSMLSIFCFMSTLCIVSTPIVACVAFCSIPTIYYLHVAVQLLVAVLRASRAWLHCLLKLVFGSYPVGTAGWLLAHRKRLRRSPAGYIAHFIDLVQAEISVPLLVAPSEHTVLPVALDNWPSCRLGLYYDCPVCRPPVTATAAHWVQHIFSGMHQRGVQTWHELDMLNWQGISRASLYT